MKDVIVRNPETRRNIVTFMVSYARKHNREEWPATWNAWSGKAPLPRTTRISAGSIPLPITVKEPIRQPDPLRPYSAPEKP